MAVAPTGNLSSILDDVRTLLSESASFQTWVGAANATEALASIHIISIDDPGGTNVRPFAVVHTPDQDWNRISTGTSIPNNSVRLTFEEDVASANQAAEADALYAFTNVMGAIVAELDAQALFVGLSIEYTAEPQRTDDTEVVPIGDVYMTEIQISWGFDG